MFGTRVRLVADKSQSTPSERLAGLRRSSFARPRVRLGGVALAGRNVRSIKNNWRRRCNAVLRELEEARNGQMFTVRCMESWLQSLDVTDS